MRRYRIRISTLMIQNSKRENQHSLLLVCHGLLLVVSRVCTACNVGNANGLSGVSCVRFMTSSSATLLLSSIWPQLSYPTRSNLIFFPRASEFEGNGIRF